MREDDLRRPNDNPEKLEPKAGRDVSKEQADLKAGIDDVRSVLAGYVPLSDNEVDMKAIRKLNELLVKNQGNRSGVRSSVMELEERVADSDHPVSMGILRDEFPGIRDSDIIGIVSSMSDEWNEVVEKEEEGGDDVETSLAVSRRRIDDALRDAYFKERSKKTADDAHEKAMRALSKKMDETLTQPFNSDDGEEESESW